jgi:hypothetical protein
MDSPVTPRLDSPLVSLAPFRRRGSLRRVAALLGLLGLFFQASLPLIDAPGGAAMAKHAGVFSLAGALCTSMRAPVKSADPGAPAQRAPLCPICLALAGGGPFVLPVLAVLVLALTATQLLPPVLAPRRAGLCRRLAALPRAPPMPA